MLIQRVVYFCLILASHLKTEKVINPTYIVSFQMIILKGKIISMDDLAS